MGTNTGRDWLSRARLFCYSGCAKQHKREQSLMDVSTPTSPLSRLSASFSHSLLDPIAKDETHCQLQQCAEIMGGRISMDTTYTNEELIQFIHHFILRQKLKKEKSKSLNNVLDRKIAFPIERGTVSISRRRSCRDIVNDSSILISRR